MAQDWADSRVHFNVYLTCAVVAVTVAVVAVVAVAVVIVVAVVAVVVGVAYACDTLASA